MRVAKLILVSAENNNKYYNMTETNSGIEVVYGRVGKTEIKEVSSKSWNSLYNSKLKKGYVDVTPTLDVVNDMLPEEDNTVNLFISKMRAYNNNLVKKTYISADSVTLEQVSKAQEIIDKLKFFTSEEETNSLLIKLYSLIPRNMANVKFHLLPAVHISSLITEEQDKLDSMKSYLSSRVVTDSQESYLGSIKTKMTLLENKPQDLETLLKGLNQSHKVFSVEANETIEDPNLTTKLLLHGTKNVSVLPIMEQGLKIRPSGNFSFSGKVYGNGNYFSEVVDKSLGYTDRGNDRVLLVYEVYTGNPFIYEGWFTGNSFPLTYEELKQRGFDSTYVKAGNGLLNSEIIVYKENRQRLKYIVWINN